IGTQAQPNTYTSQFTDAAGNVGPLQTNATYTSTPFTDTMVRNLNEAWHWQQRTITSGTLTATQSVDNNPVATVTTSFSNVVFQYNADATIACTPVSGSITTVITPEDTTKAATTILVKFGS